jgi:hypothetical protein
LVTSVAAIAAFAVGCGGPSTDDIHGALESTGAPVSYVDTDYDGQGELVAAEVGSGRAMVRTLVFVGDDSTRVERSAPWPDFHGSGTGFSGGGDTAFVVWTQPVQHLKRPVELEPGDYALSTDIENALCALNLSEEECSRP